MPAEQRRGNLAAAFQGDIAQLFRIDAGGLGDQCGLHPVLAADGAAGADHYLARIGLQRGHQVTEALVRRVGAHGDGAVAGADRRQPFHRALVEAAELALRQVQQRTAGEGGDAVAVRRALGDHRVVGHRTDAAGHVGDAHRLGQQLGIEQGALRQLAGQVETAAGGGRGDAFWALRFGGQAAGEEQGGAGEGQGAEGTGHGGFPLVVIGLPDRQRIADIETGFIGVAGEAGAVGGVAQAQGQVLQRAALEHVLEVGVAFPFLAVVGQAGDLRVVALDVAVHQGQAGDAEGGEVEIVA
ncbi:hypothetical protein D3C78_1138860 [compost metagenome]